MRRAVSPAEVRVRQPSSSLPAPVEADRARHPNTAVKFSRTKMTCILAIDPGISGAIAIYFTEAPDKVMVADMPLAGGDVNPHALRQMIESYKPDFAIIEQVSPMPKEGVSSVWRFAAAYTTARITVMLMDIPLVLVLPNIW